MTCDELQLQLLEDGAPGEAVEQHLEGCAGCRAFLADLQVLAAPLAVSASERVALAAVPGRVEALATQRANRFKSVRRLGALALAAGLGAVVATGVWHRLTPAPASVHPEAPVAESGGGLEPLVTSEALAFDDESDFEVAWPSPTTEGDVL